MSSTAPTTVASRDLIQELSWQKLQYCTMVMRMAQHMNMVYCNREREGVNSCPATPAGKGGQWGKGDNSIWMMGTGSDPTWRWTSSLPGAWKPLALVLCHHFPWMEFFITHPLFQRCPEPPAYLGQKLSASSHSKKQKKGRWKFMAIPSPLLGLNPVYFKLSIKILLHWKCWVQFHPSACF